jgi:L-alanine-DL-glutamate epimerase-like enolase superfamily enzyme
VRIAGVDAAHCAFPLTHPLRFGRAEYATRDYALMRIRTDEGIDGFACGMGRGTPIVEALRTLAPALLGRDPLRGRALLDDLLAANAPGRAALVRAHSLIELALWDITAKTAGLPLHVLLGGLRERIPALAVAGYLIEVRGEDAIVEELVGLREQGFGHLKLMIGARDAAWTHRFLSRCRDAIGAGPRLALDVHYSFPGVGEAVRVCRALEELDVAFVEDPFPPAYWRHHRALAAATRVPLAAGEDVTDALAYTDLLEAVAVLRVDPSSCGGLEPALHGIHLAETAGARVLPHGFASINAQLAGASAAIDWAEVIAPLDNGDRFSELLEHPGYTLDGGDVVLDRVPGSGTRLDWDRVEALADVRWSA